MRSPIERVTGFDVPVPIGSLEDHYIPSVSRVVEAIHKTVQF